MSLGSYKELTEAQLITVFKDLSHSSTSIVTQRSLILKLNDSTLGIDQRNEESMKEIRTLNEIAREFRRLTIGDDTLFYLQRFLVVFVCLCADRILKNVELFIQASKSIRSNQMDFLALDQQTLASNRIYEQVQHLKHSSQILQKGESDNTTQSIRNCFNQTHKIVILIEELLTSALQLGTSQLLRINKKLLQEFKTLETVITEIHPFYQGKQPLDRIAQFILLDSKNVAKICNSRSGVFATEEAERVKNKAIDDLFDVLVEVQQFVLKYSTKEGETNPQEAVILRYRPPRPPRELKKANSRGKRLTLNANINSADLIREFAKEQRQQEKLEIILGTRKEHQPPDPDSIKSKFKKIKLRPSYSTPKPLSARTKSTRRSSCDHRNTPLLPVVPIPTRSLKHGDLNTPAPEPKSLEPKKTWRKVSGSLSKMSKKKFEDLATSFQEELGSASPRSTPAPSKSRASTSKTRGAIPDFGTPTPSLESKSEPLPLAPEKSSVPPSTGDPNPNRYSPEVLVSGAWKKINQSQGSALSYDSNKLREIVDPLLTNGKNLLQGVIHQVDNPDSELKSVQSNLVVFCGYLERIAEMCQTPNAVLFEKSLKTTLEAILNSSTLVNKEIITNISNERTFVAKSIISAYKLSVFRATESFRALLSQLCTLLTAVRSDQTSSITQSGILQILGGVSSLAQTANGLLERMHTARSLSLRFQDKTEIDEDFEQGCPSLPSLSPGIWEDPTSNDLKSSPNIRGTLNQILIYLTDVDTLNEELIDAFVVHYKSITNAKQLLDKLIECYLVPVYITNSNIPQHTLFILHRWIHLHYLDFNIKIIEAIKEFAQVHVYNPDDSQKIFKLLQTEESRLRERLDVKLTPLPATVNLQSLSLNSRASLAEMVLAMDERSLAEHLTYHDWELFQKIEPREFSGLAWSKQKYRHRAPNVLALINRLNRVTFWVPTMILWHSSINDRAKVVSKFIGVLKELEKLNNFNSLLGILAGINMASVRRLDLTFMAVREDYLNLIDTYQELMNPTKNWNNYRTALRASALPALPYLGMFLGDLTFIEDGNADVIGENHINLDKRKLFHSVIKDIQRYQSVPYKIEKIEPLYTLTYELPILCDDDAYSLSLIREPRGAALSDVLHQSA